jgi:cytochrome P450
LKQVRDRFAAAAAAKVDELLERRSFDAIADLAEAYPLAIFPDALGLKQEGREHLLPYAGVVFNAFGPPNQLRQDAIERSAPHQAYVAEQCQRENLAPGGFGACIHARVDAGDITGGRGAAAGALAAVGGAGYDRQRHRRAVYCLARYPDQLARLRQDPSLARNAFEEAVRFESPVQTFFRTTTRDVEIGGHRVSEGEKVLMFLGAANRDPRRWDKPDSYDITRRTSGHVGYGSGIHMCVGQLVARLEGETMLAALARKVGAIEITGPVKRRYNNTLRGLESLP